MNNTTRLILATSLALMTACNPVQPATDAPNAQRAPDAPGSPTVPPLSERFEYAWQTVFVQQAPNDTIYNTTARTWNQYAQLDVYQAIVSHEALRTYRVSLETQHGMAAYFFTMPDYDGPRDNIPLDLRLGASANPSGLRVEFVWIDENTAALEFTANGVVLATLEVR